MAKIGGKVTDFAGNPLTKAEILIKNKDFEDLYKGKTDEKGFYEIKVEKGLYYAIAILKDYSTKYLEYWAWNVPVYCDLEINGFIGGLEVYALNVFRPQGAYPSLWVYFRPMSLERHKRAAGKENMETASIIDIAPRLESTDIDVSIQDEPVEILRVNRVTEHAGSGQGMYAYLVQVTLPQKLSADKYNKLSLSIMDRDTGEQGAASIFFDLTG